MIVVIQLCLLPAVVVGIAVRTIAGCALTAPEIVLRTPLDVIRNNEVEVAIPVVVEPRRAGGPSTLIGDSSLGSHLGEGSIAVVVIENGAAVAGDVEIRIAVVVEIPHRHALAIVALATHAGLFGHVCEGAVSVVVIKR